MNNHYILFKKTLSLLLLTICLSACGFHLRGYVAVPEWLNNVALISQDGNGELLSLLKSQLESYKIEVNSEPSLANYWLVINKMGFKQQIVSVGSSTNPRQYQLILTVEFMLQSRKGQIIKPARMVTVSRQLTVNNDRILGSNEEETILVTEMKKEAIIQIINRLSRH